MAIGTPRLLTDGTNATDATSYTITVPTAQTAGTRLFLCMYSGRTTADAAQPTSVGGTGVTFDPVAGTDVVANSGNTVMRLYEATGTLTGNVTVSYGIAMGSIGWILVEVPGALLTATSIRQAVGSNTTAAYNAINTGKVIGTFASAPVAGNAVLSFAFIASQLGSLDPLTATLTEFTNDAVVTGPVIHSGAAYDLAPTNTTYEWYSDNGSQKGIINAEILPAPVVDQWTYRRFVRIG